MAPPEQWWVLAVTTSARGSPAFQVVSSPSRPKDTITSKVAAGPFATKAAAQKWISGQQGLPVPKLPHFTLPNPFSWIGAVSHWVGDFVLHLTDIHLWISLGWILLGAFMVWWGIMLWLKVPQTIADVGTSAAARAI